MSAGLGPLDPLVDEVVAALRAGAAVVLPTDTVYGVAALPAVDGATGRLRALKERGSDTPFAVLVADEAQAASVADLTGEAARLARAHWPGPLTMVLRRADLAAGWDLGGDPSTIGVRCPDHPLVRAVARSAGPIATTSANRHGRPTPPTAPEAAAALLGEVALTVDGGPLPGAASTVVDLSGPAPRVLREGPLDAAALGLRT